MQAHTKSPVDGPVRGPSHSVTVTWRRVQYKPPSPASWHHPPGCPQPCARPSSPRPSPRCVPRCARLRPHGRGGRCCKENCQAPVENNEAAGHLRPRQRTAPVPNAPEPRARPPRVRHTCFAPRQRGGAGGRRGSISPAAGCFTAPPPFPPFPNAGCRLRAAQAVYSTSAADTPPFCVLCCPHRRRPATPPWPGAVSSSPVPLRAPRCVPLHHTSPRASAHPSTRARKR